MQLACVRACVACVFVCLCLCLYLCPCLCVHCVALTLFTDHNRYAGDVPLRNGDSFHCQSLALHRYLQKHACIRAPSLQGRACVITIRRHSRVCRGARSYAFRKCCSSGPPQPLHVPFIFPPHSSHPVSLSSPLPQPVVSSTPSSSSLSSPTPSPATAPGSSNPSDRAVKRQLARFNKFYRAVRTWGLACVRFQVVCDFYQCPKFMSLFVTFFPGLRREGWHQRTQALITRWPGCKCLCCRRLCHSNVL